MMLCSCGAVIYDKNERPLNADIMILLFHQMAGHTFGEPKDEQRDIQNDEQA